MRISFLIISILLNLVIPPLFAQTEAERSSLARTSERYDLAAPEGLHHRRFNAGGDTSRTNTATVLANAEFVHLEMGLNYRDENGVLRPSEPTIEAFPDGAIARRTAIRVIWNNDINSEGAIDFLTTGGARVRATPLGISYYDAASGKSVMLAETRSARAKIVPPNKIVYENFLGDEILADAVYEIRKSGLMQTIVIKESIEPPSAYGLSDETSRLEVITEFLDVVQPEKIVSQIRVEPDAAKRAGMIEPDFTDSTLVFDDFVIPRGVAFGLDGDAAANARLKSRPVGKHWQEMPAEGRSILFEAVEYAPVKEEFEALPKRSKRTRKTASLKREIPRKRLAAKTKEPVQVAMAEYDPRGFALDWEVVNAISSMTFQSGETYVIHANITVDHAQFQSGCIIKYDSGGSIHVSYDAPFLTSDSLNPSIFTAYDDDSYGAIIPAHGGYPASDGQPNQFTGPALHFDGMSTAATVRYGKFRYAGTALRFSSGTGPWTNAVEHSRFENCGTAVYINGVSVSLYNLKMCNVTTPYAGAPTQLGPISTDCSGGYTEIPKGNIYPDASSSWLDDPWFHLDWDPENAIDGSLAEPTWHSGPTFWPADGQWLRLDLGSDRLVGKVEYYPRGSAGNGTFEDYKIFVTSTYSNDPNAWGTPVAQGTWNWPPIQVRTLEFQPKMGRYVIFQCMDGVADWAAVGEAWVYEAMGNVIATPTISPVAGTYQTPLSVTLSCATSGAQIRYTLDGTPPVPSTGTLYAGPFQLTGTGATTVKARAFATGMTASQTATTTYTLAINNSPAISGISDITISPNNNTGPIGFTISDVETSSANLSLSGSSGSSIIPAGNIVFGGSGANRTVTVYAGSASGSAVITATVRDTGLDGIAGNSDDATANSQFTVKVRLPLPTWEVGFNTDHSSATLSASSQAGATVRYTTDGTDPSPSSSTTPPVVVSPSTTVKARAYQAGYEPSLVSTAPVIGITSPVSFSPAGHNPIEYSNGPLAVQMTAESGATVKFKAGSGGTWLSTTSGSSPAINGIDSGNGTVQAYAFTASKFRSAAAVSGEYSFRVPQPTHSIAYISGTATLTFATLPNASVDLYLDGSATVSQTLTANGAGVATAGFSTATLVKAKARKTGYIESGLTTAHVNKLWTPKIATTGGVLSSNLSVAGPTEVWLVPNFGFENAYGEDRNATGWIGPVAFSTQSPGPGYPGSFSYDTEGSTRLSSETVSASYRRTYTLSGWFKGDNTNIVYAGVINRQGDDRITSEDIKSTAYWNITYLTAALEPGATTASLANEQIFSPVQPLWTQNFFVPLLNFHRSSPFQAINQPDTLPDFYQQVTSYAEALRVTNVNSANNTVTLVAPYSGPTLQPNTPVARRAAGFTFQWDLLSNQILPPTWTKYDQTISDLRSGTDMVHLTTLLADAGGVSRMTGLELWEGTQTNRPKLYYSINGGAEVQVDGPYKITVDPGAGPQTISVRQKGTYYFDSDTVTRTISLAGPSDADGDGLPDSWEMLHFNNLNQTGAGDWDGDGLTNLQEYQSGSSPIDPALEVFIAQPRPISNLP